MNYFPLLFLCLGAGVAGFFLRRKSAALGTSLLALACVGAAFLLGRQVYRFSTTTTARPVNRFYATVAYYLGYEVLGELRGLEGSIGLILPPDTRTNQRMLDSLFDTFARVLSPLPTLRVLEAPLETKPRWVDEGKVPLEAFERALAQVPNALAYVSFAGVPTGIERLSLWAQSNAPPVFVFDPSGGTNWVAALKQGRLRRVIVPRPEARQGRGTPTLAGPPDEIFQRFFLLATPANAETIAAQMQR